MSPIYSQRFQLTKITPQPNALAWSLTKDEVKALDDATSKLPPLVPPESNPFPKKSIEDSSSNRLRLPLLSPAFASLQDGRQRR